MRYIKNMHFIKYFSTLALIVVAVVYFQNRPSSHITLYGDTMGTYYTIKINSSIDNKLLNNKVKEELKLINAQMSVFDTNSEISRINRSDADTWIPVSDGTSEVLQASQKIYTDSQGYFDPTMGKLIDIWGFGATQQKKNPTNEEIKEVLKHSGFDKLKFSHDYKSIKKTDSQTFINLSAIAKGYAVDRVAELLRKENYTDFVVEIGGEVKALGNRKENEQGWNIGVVDPKTSENAYIISLKDFSAATSGDYRNFHYVGEKKLSHTISPRDGHPVDHNLASVTVFDKSCMRADGLATAIMAMGEKKGVEFANNYGIPVIMFTRDADNNIQTIISQKAQKLIKEQGFNEAPSPNTPN